MKVLSLLFVLMFSLGFSNLAAADNSIEKIEKQLAEKDAFISQIWAQEVYKIVKPKIIRDVA